MVWGGETWSYGEGGGVSSQLQVYLSHAPLCSHVTLLQVLHGCGGRGGNGLNHYIIPVDNIKLFDNDIADKIKYD